MMTHQYEMAQLSSKKESYSVALVPHVAQEVGSYVNKMKRDEPVAVIMSRLGSLFVGQTGFST